MNSLISVIVPAYNEEKYINKTLKSIRKQKYSNYEIVVVDNGSNDQTTEIASKFTSKVFCYKKKGAAKARNYGAKQSNGDIFVFWDADTITKDRKLLSKTYQAAKEGFSGGSTNIVAAGDSYLEKLYNVIANHTDKFLFYKLGKKNIFSYTPFVFCKREIFMKIGGFPEGLQATEEIKLLDKINKEEEIKFIEDSHVLPSNRRIEKLGVFYGGFWLPFYHFFFPQSEKFPYKSVK